MVASDLGLHRFTLVTRLGFLVVCSCVHGERRKDHRGLRIITVLLQPGGQASSELLPTGPLLSF